MLGQYVVDIKMPIQATINADKGQLSAINDGTQDDHTAVSSVHVLTDVFFNIAFVLSSSSIMLTENLDSSVTMTRDN